MSRESQGRPPSQDLADTAIKLNGFAALLIWVGASVYGFTQFDGGRGLIWSAGGFIAAGVFCGPMAVLADIRRILQEMQANER